MYFKISLNSFKTIYQSVLIHNKCFYLQRLSFTIIDVSIPIKKIFKSVTYRDKKFSYSFKRQNTTIVFRVICQLVNYCWIEIIAVHNFFVIT